jgi:ABC-type phosphate transport system substrate-binding protein
MRRRVVLTGLAALVPAVPGRAANVEFRVVTHPGLRLSEVSREELSGVFLRKTTSWSGGTPAAPVDQSLRSPVRSTFSSKVLGMSLISVQAYWQKHISTGGDPPPPVLGSDDEVLAFVASTPGAVGYIQSTTMVPARVREVALKR